MLSLALLTVLLIIFLFIRLDILAFSRTASIALDVVFFALIAIGLVLNLFSDFKPTKSDSDVELDGKLAFIVALVAYFFIRATGWM